MQISHIEVRRHPIWQREVHRDVHNERQIAGPNAAISPRGRAILATALGAVTVAVLLVLATR